MGGFLPATAGRVANNPNGLSRKAQDKLRRRADSLTVAGLPSEYLAVFQSADLNNPSGFQ
jgi:hypothetical protein